MRCTCDVKLDSDRPDESLPHRRHIYAAQTKGGLIKTDRQNVWIETRTKCLNR